MSKKKAAGKLKQQKRPQPKYLGLKVAHGEKVGIGSILIRQRGSRFKPGSGVKESKDHSLFAVTAGVVKFGQRLGKKTISVVEQAI